VATFLELDSLSKSYKKPALREVSFGVARGDFVAVVGPSGAGKSTLLRLVGGLDVPDSGRVLIEGADITGQMPAAIRRRVGMVFQTPVLFDASVYDNISYGLRFRRTAQAEISARVSEALRALYLCDLRDRNALTLSGGEAQRVALARILVYRPDLLLLDEPTANLDPYNVSIIEEVLREANRAGTTIIIVTHNIFQAKRLTRRVAFLLSGELVEIADTRTFFEQPGDKRTSQFIRGEMIY